MIEKMLEGKKSGRNELGKGQNAQLDGNKPSRYTNLLPTEQDNLY